MKIKMVLGAIIVLAITLIGGNTMALSKLTTELNTISELDTVIRNQATTVKAAFDHDVNVVKDYINNTLTAEADTTFETKANITTSRKLSATGDFTGTWHGYLPVETDPGIQAVVNGHTSQIAMQNDVKNCKFMNNKNATLTYGTSINFVGDSIFEGTKTLDFVNDGCVGIINKAIQMETDYRNHGFVSFWDVTKIYGIAQYHALTKLGFGDGTFDASVAGGISITSSTSGDYIEATYTGYGAKLIYSQMVGGGAVSITLDGVAEVASLDTSIDYGFFNYYAASQFVTNDSYGTHVIRITKLDNLPTKLMGMLYMQTDGTPYVNNFARSSMTLTELTNDNLLNFYCLSGMTVLALGVNDQIGSTSVAAYKERLAYICDQVVANKGNLIICDFMFSLPSDNPYKQALKDNFKLYPQFQLLDFGEMWFSNTTKNIAAGLLDVDGVHPTVEGHEFIANVIMKYMGLPYTKKTVEKSIGTRPKNLTLLNSWVNFGGTAKEAKYYIKDGIAYFEGLIKNGTTTEYTHLFTFPSDALPSGDEFFSTSCDTGSARLAVTAATNTMDIVSGSNGWLSLSGVSYRLQ